MNVSNEQIELEFIRQVRLCSGIGREKMEHILWQFWETRKPGTTQPSYVDKVPTQNGNKRATARRGRGGNFLCPNCGHYRFLDCLCIPIGGGGMKC